MSCAHPWNLYILYMEKGLCKCDYVKDLEIRILSWNIRVDPKCNYKGRYKKK